MIKGKKFFVATYGCQMNVHESEKIAGQLVDRGCEQVLDIKDADIVVFNTCCIREGAEQKIMGNIGAVKPLKKQKKDMIVAVCGCMSQQKNMANTLRKKFPFIDIIFGANNVEFFGEYLDTYLEQKKYQDKVVQEENYMEKGSEITISRDNKLHAYVNIIYGCNNFCTYCIVPYVRGREKSRKPEDIYNEVTNLVKMGYKIITLLGQNVNSYGKDLENKLTFAELLQNICNIEGDFEVRFMSSHPKDLTMDVIDVIANNPKISRAIHLPVQSGSNSVLKAMNRNYTREKYLSQIQAIKEKIPGVMLSTDIIVGFPGETEQDYQDTVDLIKQVQYANAFIFIYSKRSGTVAEKMENQIPLNIKRDRIHNLLSIQHEISNNIFANLVGSEVKVLVEDEDENSYITKTQCGKIAKVTKQNQQLQIGDFVMVKIVDYKKGDLIAELSEE